MKRVCGLGNLVRLWCAVIVLLVAACAIGVSFANAEPIRNMPQPHRLYAPCPWTPWALPKDQGIVKA